MINYKIFHFLQTVNLDLNYGGKSPTLKGGPLDGIYTLKNVHFHWGLLDNAGSEHMVDGLRTTMEGHFVFKKQDQIAVIGVLYQSTENGVRLPIDNLAGVSIEGGSIFLTTPAFSLRDFIPNDFIYATYKGSLTVPPCSETVDWFVSTDIMGFNVKQVTDSNF